MKNSNRGRTAHEYVRDQALELAAKYRPVAESADGRYCANPDNHPEEQTWITTEQALRHVLAALDRFAETGTFDVALDIHTFDIREAYRKLRCDGMNRSRAIEKLTSRYSQSTIERAIRVDKTIAKANAERMAATPAVKRAYIQGAIERKL